jgi:Flp pilus assembly protein TadB
MEEKQDQKNTLISMAIKLVLSLAVLFPVYVLLFVTFPASIIAMYVIGACVLAAFAPWEDLKRRFLK